MTTPIPQPPAVPFFGNIGALDQDLPLRSFALLAETYGEIYQLNILGRQLVVVNTNALVNEISDEKRFAKNVGAHLNEVRNIAGNGLFTSQTEDPNWGKAHRLLIPAFGAINVRNMFGGIKDICQQLLLKWERFGPDAEMDPTIDYTKLAIDALALCAMSYRLNSFYMEGQSEFTRAMTDALKESFARYKRPSIVQAFMTSSTAKYEADIKTMKDVAKKIVADRKEHPIDKKDLLNVMLNGKDPKTGEGLSDEVIRDNLLTLLIAGHETSSSMLAFITYYLVKNPEVTRKLRAEIDETVGDRSPEFEDLGKMKYLHAVMYESSRLQPPAPARVVAPIEDTTIGGGKYFVKAGVDIMCQEWVQHRDPAIWGEDALEFKPERMLDGKFEALPHNAWQPFGNGKRSCIGRPFAWLEIQLAVASIIQRFDLSLVDPSYTLDYQQSITIKPKNFRIRAAVRSDAAPHRLAASPSTPLQAAQGSPANSTAIGDAPVKPLYVLYGSNTGTSESFAQRIASDAVSYGFRSSLGTLDSAAEHIPTDGPVIIVTASFEGEPADNAARFVDWLSHLNSNELAGVRYTVFGCGNHEWAQTYQRIPKLCDSLIDKHGGKRLLERGEGDAGDGSFFQVFDEYEIKLWEALAKEYKTSKDNSVTSGFIVKTLESSLARADALRQPDAALGRVIENRILTKPGAPVKRHIEFRLPDSSSARAGDYLAILPQNPVEDVRRVLAHFGLSNEQQVTISSVGPTPLPVEKAVNLTDILGGYIELSQPTTTRDLRSLIDATTSDDTRKRLQDLIASYPEKVLAQRLSVLDILESHKDITLSLSKFVEMLPPMRVRQYSISSSPLWNPEHVTLTISVVDGPALCGREGHFLGVASNYLANLRSGDQVQMAVRPSAAAFAPPADPLIPIVMFCAGSGLAPMRGFIQERAVQKKSGRDVGQCLLFFGCRSPNQDFLYSDSDLAEWVKLGVVEVRPAFSQSEKDSEGCKHVQDRVWHDKEDISRAYKSNAKFFTCGSNAVATAVKAKLIEIIRSYNNLDEAEATARFDAVTKGRYATDIFD